MDDAHVAVGPAGEEGTEVTQPHGIKRVLNEVDRLDREPGGVEERLAKFGLVVVVHKAHDRQLAVRGPHQILEDGLVIAHQLVGPDQQGALGVELGADAGPDQGGRG